MTADGFAEVQLQKLFGRHFGATAVFFVVQGDVEKGHAIAETVGIDIEADFITGRGLQRFCTADSLIAGGEQLFVAGQVKSQAAFDLFCQVGRQNVGLLR